MYIVINLENGTIKLAESNDALDSRYPNLSVGEYACNDGCEVVPYHPRIVELFQRLRNIFGPLTCNSGFRTTTHNASPAVGGASDSQHIYGLAMDIKTPSDITDELFLSLAKALGGYQGGYGLYNGRIHIDCRDGFTEWDSKN